MVSLDFASGTASFWSGIGTIIWNGITFAGAGTFGSINQIPETTDGSAQGVTMTLSGVKTDAIALAVQQGYQGGQARVWLGCFSLTDDTLVLDPYLFFKGKMDVMTIQDGVKTASISLSCENRLIEYDRARERRYTDFDQHIDFPTDTGLQYINSIQNLQVYWGDPNGANPSLPGAGGVGALNR